MDIQFPVVLLVDFHPVILRLDVRLMEKPDHAASELPRPLSRNDFHNRDFLLYRPVDDADELRSDGLAVAEDVVKVEGEFGHETQYRTYWPPPPRMPETLIAAPPDLTTCQAKALDILQREGNVFLTGAAGTGKSFLLQRFLQGKPDMEFPVVASTGAAAVLVGGRTFHSFFGLGILEGGMDAAVARALRSRKVVHRLNRAWSIVIDEVSMLSGELLKAAEIVSRKARGKDAPWGGLRIIAVGDFAQLPPISRAGQTKDWAFLHDVWRESKFQPALLSTVVRTREPEFLQILNFVREGIVNDEVSAFLDERRTSYPSENCTRIYPHRMQAQAYNLERLGLIDRPLHTFPTSYEGDERYLPLVRRAIPIPETLQLKKSALVMMRKNDLSPDRRWVNGSLGFVRDIREDELDVELLNGEEVTVQPEKFTYLGGDGEEVASAWNFPVTLAWAATIHKAQGASVDRIHVDLSELWEPGQAYVALSRTRSAEGLTIHRWNRASIRVDTDVTHFYDSLSDSMLHYVPRPLCTTPAPASSEETSPRSRKKKKPNRYAETKRMLGERATVEAIARHHGIQPGRIPHHIDHLLEKGEELDLSYLREQIDGFDLIRSVFMDRGADYLKPVFDSLQGDVPYETLHLVRCIMRWEKKTGER